MAQVKTQLKQDLVAAMKARDEEAKSTLRMALAAIANEEVAGKQARQLSADEELAVLTKEAAKRKDSAEAYTAGNRPELAAKELREAAILATYLPQPLAESDVAAMVADEVAKVAAQLGGAPTVRQLGQIIKAVNARVAGRFEGARVAALVKAALA